MIEPTSLLDVLKANRECVSLYAFAKRRTYRDMFLGSPTRKINTWLESKLIEEAGRYFPLNCGPVLLLNCDLVIDNEDEQSLPEFICFGRFFIWDETFTVEQTSYDEFTAIWYEIHRGGYMSIENQERLLKCEWKLLGVVRCPDELD